MLVSLLALALGQSALPRVDGTRLSPGTVCYAITRGDTPIGATRQTVSATTVAGTPAWDVVVHQRVGGGKFDLRDHFVLRRADLTPIAFDSRKSGVEHVRVDYASGKLVTTRPGAAPQELAVAGPVWDGNLWGLTFAALPLAAGAHFELPFYQYDKGLGRFRLDVTGSEKVAGRDAWVVEASADGERKVRYFIAKDDRVELGYAGTGFAQRSGGDCSAIAQAGPAFQAFTQDFDQFAQQTAQLPEAERVRLFRERFNALVPGFYEPRGGITEERYNGLIAKGLADYPANRDKFLAAARDFRAAYDGGTTRFRRFFPDYAPTMPVYLLHSLGEMDGGTRDLHGKSVAVFGADVIARIHDSASIGPFLDHELFHFYHGQFFPDCDQLWCSLWQEGLAVYVASKMNPTADDRALMLTIPRPIRPEVEPRFAEAVCLARAKFDSTSRDDYGEFFFGNGSGKVFPPRFGYYLGYRLVQAMGARYDLQTLARMKPAQVRTALQETMAKLASCR